MTSVRPAPVDALVTRWRRPTTTTLTVVVLFLAAHVALGIVASQFRVLATIHGAAVILGGLVLALTTPRIDRVLKVAGYAATCDVFWRMSRSQVPFEMAKYAALGFLLIGFVRFVKRPQRTAVPIAYLVCLLPGIAITMVSLPLDEARQLVSANLAGPALLAIGVLVLRQVTAAEAEVVDLLWVLLGPIVAVAAISTRATAEAGTEAFDSASGSNFAAVGGFGPNQVSMLLGFGALVCVLWALQKVSVKTLLVQIAVGGWLTAQAALTFSRGGLYGAAAGVAAVAVAALATSGMRSRMMMAIGVGVVVAVVAFPYLNEFTNGSLERRFADTSSTNRGEIATADLELFEQEPLLGVGVGMAKYQRSATETGFAVQARAHTEFSRMLGEHGVLGLLSLGFLVAMAIQAIRSATGRWNRLFAAALVMWSLVSMSHSATSIAAIAFAFGLANLRSTPSGSPSRA